MGAMLMCMWGVLLLLGCAASFSDAENYTLCVLPRTPSYYSSAEICDKLGPTPIRCITGVDRLDCLRKMSDGSADLAVLEAEDLLIAAEDKQLSDILVTHRIHATEDKRWEFAVVALVSNRAHVSKLSGLRGKRLCHPGNDPFSSNYDWSEVFSLYFENRVAPQFCEKEVSVEENRIKALSEFFGESCKPGVWAADPQVDEELKKKYKSMCGLCDVPSVCSQRDKYWGRQGALFCLSDCLGDVAWSMLKDAKLHFSNIGVSVCSDVSLLCPDDSTMPLNSTKPCIWVSRPVPVIAVRRTKVEDVARIVKQVLVMPDSPDDFVRLLESSMLIPPLQLSPSLIPKDYLATAPGFLSANSMSVCGQGTRAVSLCVSTLQDKIKCEWLEAVSKVYGVQPSMRCMYGANCLISVANSSADVTIAVTDKLLPALRDHSLKPLLVQLPIQLKKAKTVSAVVKTKSKIRTFSDLKGKRACFPSIDGMGWTSFAIQMKKTDSFDGICPYTTAMSKFFSEICIAEPSPSVSKYENIKVCSTEPSYKTNNGGELQEISFDNDAVAFQCLAIGGGDVAFISTDDIPEYLDSMKGNPEAEGLTVGSFRALCDATQSTGCHLSWASSSQVLVHTGLTPSRQEDIRSLFTGLNNLFSHHNTPSTRTFNMFAPMNSLFDVEVNSETENVQQRLEQYDDFLKKAKLRPKNYESAVVAMEKCIPSSATIVATSLTFLAVSLMSLIYIN